MANDTAPPGRHLSGWALRIIAIAFAAISGLALLILCAVTVISVFFRYALVQPLHGTEDVSTMALTVVVAGAVVWAATTSGHIAVNVWPKAASGSLTRSADTLARAISAALAALAAYGLAVQGRCGLLCGDITPNMGWPHTPFYYVLSAAMAVVALVMLLHLALGLAHWSGDDPNAVAP